MAKYAYPAIFTLEENGQYVVNFPDVFNCFTQGDDIQDALHMANDVLCLMLYDLEESNATIPPASNPKDIQVDEKSFVSLVPCDTMEYRKFHQNKAVKKTLTIPFWLNSMAEKENINFSATLQDALKKELHLAE